MYVCVTHIFYDTNVVNNLKKPTGFVTYIDESGDEGFVFKSDGSGSSRWFVLSAVVTRRFNDLQMVECLRDTRKVLGKAPKTPLHFADLKHEQRVPYVRRVGNLDIRTINIAVYKPSIREVSRFQGTKHLLYRYTTRLLVERLSWMLARTRRGVSGQNRSVEIIFSDRANMSYGEIRSYLGRLIRQSKSAPDSVRVDGSVIDPTQVRSVQHSQLSGFAGGRRRSNGSAFRSEAEPLRRDRERLLFAHRKDALPAQRQGFGLRDEVLARRVQGDQKKNPPNRAFGGFPTLRPQVTRIPPLRAAALHERPLQLLRLP